MPVYATKMSQINKILKYSNYLLRAKTAHGVHSPFVFKLIHELIETEDTNYYQFKELNELRKELLNDQTELQVTDLGAGSKIFKEGKRKISEIAKVGISKKKFSELLFKLVNFCDAKTIVELGTSIGLNALYFAKANSKSNVYSIEGCKELSKFASQLAKKEKAGNINFIVGNFDDEFPKLLNRIPNLDLLFVDGNHRYQPTISYFKMALEKKSSSSVLIFDDIHWSEEMEKAWDEIKSHSEVTLTIDLFFVGLVFFRTEQKEKQHFVLKY
jgi:predicted O-methyltransferase YrrM